jgi:eukaryotic-like serine/threonine-protein kinase
MPLAPGTKLGPYEILSPLGAGGMGEVYRAQDTRLGRDVAVKILPKEFSDDPMRKQRFQREAKIISGLNHPNICVLHDIGSENGVDYLVMECVEGETLAMRLTRGLLAPDEISEYAIQILDGLGKAHSKGIIHRDLKPGNIMLTRDGRAKVLDFGLAKQNEQTADASAVGGGQTIDFVTTYATPAGTYAYMSPEQTLGRQMDARSDLFSFGTTLYEMATGRRPFNGRTPAEISDAVLHVRPTPPGQMNPNIPEALQDIIAKCLEKDPSLRYQAAAEIVRDFRRTTRIDNLREARIDRNDSSSGRSKTRMSVWVTGVIVLSLVSGIALWPRHRDDSPAKPAVSEIRSVAVLPLKNLSADASQEYFADGTTLDLITTLTKINSVSVISWTSVRGYKNSNKRMAEIAKDLNVDAIIDGSVRRSGDRVKITIELVEARGDRNLWAQSYDRELRDILQLQGEVASTIAREIRVVLTPQDRARLSGTHPVDPAAYLLYVQGRSQMQRWTPETSSAARTSFQQAIQQDPSYGPAYAGLAETYLTGGDLDPKLSTPLARVAAAKALALDETISDAHVATAQLAYMDRWDWEGAEREFQRAIELNPGDTLAHHLYSHLLLTLGRNQESMRESELCVRLDPLSPVAYDHLGFQYLATGQYDAAIEAYRKPELLDPSWQASHLGLGDAYRLRGMSQEALLEYDRAAVAGKIDPKIVKAAHEAFEKGGWRGYWNKSIEKLSHESKHGYISPYSLAQVYSRLENKEQTLLQLEKAFVNHDYGLTALTFERDFYFLHGDRRYEDLLKRMGLPISKDATR